MTMKLTEIRTSRNDVGGTLIEVYFAADGKTYSASQRFIPNESANIVVSKLQHIAKLIANINKDIADSNQPVSPKEFTFSTTQGDILYRKLEQFTPGVIFNPSLVHYSLPNGLYVIKSVIERECDYLWTLLNVAPSPPMFSVNESVPGDDVGIAARCREVLDSAGVPRFVETNSLKYTCAICGTTKIKISPKQIIVCECGSDTFVKG